MGGLNQDTWKQPPASLSVEWPTKSTFKDGPSLEEQKARMRETRTKVSNAIASSGFAVPRWPEIGQQVKWHPPKTSRGDGLSNLTSHQEEQSSSIANRIPLRYQSSTTDGGARSPVLSELSEEGRTLIAQHDSLISQLIGRRRDRLRQPENTTPGNTLTAQDDVGIRGFIDPSIFNPRINVVHLPDLTFLRPPPAAPRAMLEHMSSQDRPSRFGQPGSGRNPSPHPSPSPSPSPNPHNITSGGRPGNTQNTFKIGSSTNEGDVGCRQARFAGARGPRRRLEATETSFDSVNTRRARGYFSATSGAHHSFEPTFLDCGDEYGGTAVYNSPGIDITDRSLETPNQEWAQPSATFKAESRHILDTPRVVGPPPGFEPHDTIHRGTTPRPGSSVVDSESDYMNGRWSQSLIWYSEEERLRLNFSRMQERAHHLGLDKSPFLPESVRDYAALLAERKAAEVKRIRKKIQQNERAARTHLEEEAMVSHRSQLINANCLFFGEALIDEFVQTAPPPQQQIELFRGNRARDGLSSVLAMESCFNEIPTDAPESERVDWPPDAEFRSWKGSRPRPPPGFARRRSSSHRGAWPFPRSNVPYRPQDSFPNNDIPYSQRRMIFVPRWDWMPKFAKTLPDESHISTPEPLMTDTRVLLPSDLFLEE